MMRGFELYNTGDFDGLREFVSADIVLERLGGGPAIEGWDAFRAFQNADAFEWQRLDPLDWTVNGDKVIIRIRVRAKGAGSGLELDLIRFQVWTLRDGIGVHVVNTTNEDQARAAAGL